jgi:hypothetical protein
MERIFEKSNEQQKTTRGRRPTDKVNRRLRELLSDRDIKKRRQQLINQLSEQFSHGSIPVPSTSVPPKNTELSPSTFPQQTEIAERHNQKLGIIDAEQLLSDVIAVVESKLPAGDTLVAELCQAIQGVFVAHGLIDAEE